MKGVRVCVFVLLCLAQSVICEEGCQLNFTNQPPPELPCRPSTKTALFLYCYTSDGRISVTWYHTQNEDQAGNNGSAISSNSSEYSFYKGINYFQPQLAFMINDKTVGYYWCVVTDDKYSNVLLMPSTVAHIQSINDYNSSLGPCDDFQYLHNPSNQCAIVALSPSLTPTLSISSSEASIIQDYSSTIITTGSSSIASEMSSSMIYFALSNSSSFLVPSRSISASHVVSLTDTSSHFSTLAPTLSLSASPNPEDTENNPLILFVLAAVCGLLAVIALAIVIAIFVLCYLTKHQARRSSYTPKGQAEEDSSGVANNSNEKTLNHSPDVNTNNNINPGLLLQARGLSFSNPVYDIAKVNPTNETSFDIFPPRIVPPDNPNRSNSLPKYSKPDLKKKRHQSEEEYVSPCRLPNTNQDDTYDPVPAPQPEELPLPLPTNSTGVYDNPLSPDVNTVTSHPPPFQNSQELDNLYDAPHQAPPSITSPPAPYEEPSITSPSLTTSPPPLPPPPPDSVVYDDPHQVTSPTQSSGSYKPPRLLNNEENENYYSMPVDGVPHEYHELQAPLPFSDEATKQYPNNEPNNNTVPQESAYDDPWGPMPTGIKRGSSRSYKSGTRSRSVNHSTSPNLFDDPQYDTPSPHQTTPVDGTNNYCYSTIDN